MIRAVGFADYERGFVGAFNDFLAHEILYPYTPKNGIILTSGNLISNRLTNDSFIQPTKFIDIKNLRLVRNNVDNVFISSYGHILYSHENGQLTTISTANITEAGRNITVIPNNIYYELNLGRHCVQRYNYTVNLAMRCFQDFFERAKEDAYTSDMLFKDYLYELVEDDRDAHFDPFTAGYQNATNYLDHF